MFTYSSCSFSSSFFLQKSRPTHLLRGHATQIILTKKENWITTYHTRLTPGRADHFIKCSCARKAIICTDLRKDHVYSKSMMSKTTGIYQW